VWLYIVEVSTQFKILYQALDNSVPFQELREHAHELYSTTRASKRTKNTNTEKEKSGEYIVCVCVCVCVTTQSMILHNNNSTVF
jgi:hypothetical protein